MHTITLDEVSYNKLCPLLFENGKRVDSIYLIGAPTCWPLPFLIDITFFRKEDADALLELANSLAE